MRRTGFILPLAVVVVACSRCDQTPGGEPDHQTKAAISQLISQIGEAQRQENEAEVRRLASKGRVLLGDFAGVPETPDEFRSVPADVQKLSAEEVRRGFDPYLKLIGQRRWWRIGLDPTKTQHLPREVASVIAGCVAAHRAKLAGSDKAMEIAKAAGDYLIWTQEQGGHGLVPFPAVRGGQGRVFEVSERFLQRAERDGKLDQALHNGWVVDDLGDGGMQFDNGLCGVAFFELYEVTKEDRYRKAAVSAADWAIGRSSVPNWNYNSFSVYLLAKAHAVTREDKYLESAKKKARLGIYPGQLLDGKYQGRWADPHNARPAYHYIIVRGLATLLAVMPPNDPDRRAAIQCLTLALKARNPDFVSRVTNPDSALEALILVTSIQDLAEEYRGCHTEAALEVLERYASAGFHANRPVLSPGVWGRYLEFVVQRSCGDSRDQPVTPLPGDGGPRTIFLVKGDALDEVAGVASQEWRPQPVARLPTAARHDRLVHQVITEDGWALSTAPCHGFPESGLRLPPLLLPEPVVPVGHVLLAVTTQSGDVEVQPQLLGQSDEAAQPIQGALVRLIGAGHELAELKVNSHHIRPKLLHLPEVLFDLGPFLLPIVLQETTFLIVIVV
jgi:hypothetical protein